MIGIQLQGVNQLFATLDRAASIQVLRPPMERGLLILLADMAKYPKQRSDTKYRRTGTLGRRWTKSVTVNIGGIEGRLGNNTPYGPYVQDSQRQARVHHGVWQTDESVVNRRKGQIESDFDQEIGRALKR